MAFAPIETRRLLLRQWRTEDRPLFVAMNQDPEVMRFFPAPKEPAESNEAVNRFSAEIDSRGWSNWAVETREEGAFIGFVGLSVPRYPLPFQPGVEVGWRLARPFWGRGYATEAGNAALAFGFERLALDAIVSFTAVINTPSRRVMERLGMRDTQRDFDHPAVPEGSTLRRHCLYRITRDDWRDRPRQPAIPSTVEK